MEAQLNSHYPDLLDKTANFWSPDPAVAAIAQNQARRKMWQGILMAFGVGGLSRGALGAARMLESKPTYEPKPSYQQVDMLRDDEEEEKLGMDKSARTWTEAISDGTKGVQDWALKPSQPWWLRLFAGEHASNWHEVPAVWAGGLAGGAGAFYGGYKGVDKLMDMRRKAELDAKKRHIQDQYAELLAATKKAATAENIEDELEELATLCIEHEKQADMTAMTPFNYGTGMMSTYALLSAILSGKMSYDYFKNRSQRAVSEEALRRRAKERSGGVSPIYLTDEQSIA